MLSRRSFLRSGTLTALSLSLAAGTGRLVFGQRRKGSNPGLDFQIPDSIRQDPLLYYNQAAFESYLGSTFTAFGAAGGMANLTLVSVTGYKPNPDTVITTAKARETECFSLRFNASDSLPTFIPIHTLNHDALGKINLFMTERKTDRGEIFYEAVINHAPGTTGAPVNPKRPRTKVIKPDSP